MKINLEKLKEVEERYKEVNLPNYTLHLMINRVVSFEDAPYSLAPNNLILSITTLRELGILEIEGIKGMKDMEKPQQLNS